MAEIFQKIVRVEDIDRKSPKVARKEWLQAKKEYLATGTLEAFSENLQKHNEWCAAAVAQSERQIVIFDSLRVKIPR